MSYVNKDCVVTMLKRERGVGATLEERGRAKPSDHVQCPQWLPPSGRYVYAHA